MKPACQVRIDSYFSLPTDLAEAMRTWPEFVRGRGYDVELQSEFERVTTQLVPARGDDVQYVLVSGDEGGRLFLLALGAVTYAMAANSDDVTSMRWYER